MCPREDRVEWMSGWIDGVVKIYINTGTWREATAKERQEGEGEGEGRGRGVDCGEGESRHEYNCWTLGIL